MVRVYNKKHGDAPEDAVYVGRPTQWGNKFTHLQHKTKALVVVGSLAESIEKYFGDLIIVYLDQEKWNEFVDPLREKDLICWCAPPGGIDIGFKPDHVICHAQLLGALVKLDTDLRKLNVDINLAANLEELVDVGKIKKDLGYT